ncbi:hypothetical protein C2W62_16700 [Candidatus Entotheonella serta]|nr:hypothetical protein C2W62_16700 [Candidatus Entotheonella serta]
MDTTASKSSATTTALAFTCTPAPPRPADGPSDWTEAVRPNCFNNLERLGRWIGGTDALGIPTNPESCFTTVEPGSLGTSAVPGNHIAVLVHGWSPGYRTEVDAANGQILWWSNTTGNASGVWPSTWAWTPTQATVDSSTVTTTHTRVFQELQNQDIIVLGYSWTDDSATGGSLTDLIQVYQSEAYTNINGLRLADALEQAIAPAFWCDQNNILHLIGHSHGSKVATVATLALQQRGLRVNHLTILDSPENERQLDPPLPGPLNRNGANLLGFYLNELAIATPPTRSTTSTMETATSGTFIDSYISAFGVGFQGEAKLSQIVEVTLDPAQIYGDSGVGDSHSYAAAWYGGAAVGAQAAGCPPVGLDWSPVPAERCPSLNQTFSAGVTTNGQWQLTKGSATHQVRKFSTDSLDITQESTSGNVTTDCLKEDSTVLSVTFGTATMGGGTAIFNGSYRTSDSQS